MSADAEGMNQALGFSISVDSFHWREYTSIIRYQIKLWLGQLILFSYSFIETAQVATTGNDYLNKKKPAKPSKSLQQNSQQQSTSAGASDAVEEGSSSLQERQPTYSNLGAAREQSAFYIPQEMERDFNNGDRCHEFSVTGMLREEISICAEDWPMDFRFISVWIISLNTQLQIHSSLTF